MRNKQKVGLKLRTRRAFSESGNQYVLLFKKDYRQTPLFMEFVYSHKNPCGKGSLLFSEQSF